MISKYYTTQKHTQKQLDLYLLPKAQNSPVVIWVHGGAWRHRTRRDEGPKLAAFFHQYGYLFASIDHRYAPNPPDLNDQNAYRHPAQIQDVVAAIAWIFKNARSFHGDPNRLLLIGHSSGAHLVTLAAFHQKYLRKTGTPYSAIRAVASLDVRAYDIPTLLENAPNDVAVMYRNAFGSDPELWRDASPIYHLNNQEMPPILVAVRGNAQSKKIKKDFLLALAKNGANTTLLDVSTLNHAQVRDSIGQSNDKIVGPAIISFFKHALSF